MRLQLYMQTSLAYHRFVWSSILFPKSKGKKTLAGYCLLNRKDGSFRLQQSEHSDFLIILKYAYRLVKKWMRGGEKNLKTTGNPKIALYDAATEPQPRLDFIKSVEGIEPGFFFDKEKLSFYSHKTVQILFKTLGLGVNVIALLPFMFSQNRAKMALMLFEIDECATLLWLLQKHNIKTLYYSCIYEKDANACTLLLQKHGIKVIKNPSEDPLYFHNQILIADELGICNPYQKQELEHYKDTIFINGTKKWFPEMHLKHLKGKTWQAEEQNVLGYYSGSSWLRIKLNYNLVNEAYDSYSAEAELEEHIRTFKKENPQYKLRIFLHPLEKKHLELTKEHFQEIWGDIEYEFEDLEKHTTETFHRCTVAITVFSGVMYYRYYAGYRGIMYCPKMPNFPIEGSLLDAVSAKNYKQLEERLNQQLSLTNEAFHKQVLKGEYEYV